MVSLDAPTVSLRREEATTILGHRSPVMPRISGGGVATIFAGASPSPLRPGEVKWRQGDKIFAIWGWDGRLAAKPSAVKGIEEPAGFRPLAEWRSIGQSVPHWRRSAGIARLIQRPGPDNL